MTLPDTEAHPNLANTSFTGQSLLRKTLVFVCGITVLTAAVIILITVALTSRQFERQASNNLDEMIDAMRSMASIACFTKDTTLARETAHAFIKNSNVLQVSITAYGNHLANATRPEALEAQISAASSRFIERSVSSPFDDNEIIGSIKVVPNWPEIERNIGLSVRSNVAMMIILACGIILVVAATTTFFIVRPVKRISDGLHALNVSHGDVLHIPDGHEQNELGRLVGDFNDLVAHLRLSLDREHALHLQQVIHERLRLLAAVFENSLEGIIITDSEHKILTVNRAFSEITGYPENEVIDKHPSVLASNRHNEQFYAQMQTAISSQGFWKGEVWTQCKNGNITPQWVNISAVRDENGNLVNHLGIFSDITERKQAEERIAFLAHHDALTHLPNRILVREEFEHAVANSRQDNTGIALLYIDLDNFKYVNDTFGHRAGDQILLTIVERLKQQIRAFDTISRQGGDEFLIILPNIHGPALPKRVAEQILASLAPAFNVEGHTIGISASIGIAMYPSNGKDFETLLKNADVAMYAAKNAGKNAFRFFAEEMNVDVLDKLKLKIQLREAIDKHEFQLVYQPQINMKTGAIIGAEALIRWHHPENGIISPARFIPVAEESGMIGEIGDWVIGEACRQGKEWQDKGVQAFVIAVNISPRQFNNSAVLDTVRYSIARFGFPAEYLELEVTESGLLSDIDHSLSTIDQLRATGVQLSIDDFGTGYSSLSYLQLFKVNKLKIDQSFVRRIDPQSDGLGIVQAIIQLGKTLNLTVIAEGVETSDQLDALRKLGCDEIQGYLISHPLYPDDFLRFALDWSAKSKP